MRKILLSLVQITVTVAVLIWVFHDPNKRAQMGIALRAADYRWIGFAVLAYGMVEFAAAVRWLFEKAGIVAEPSGAASVAWVIEVSITPALASPEVRS